MLIWKCWCGTICLILFANRMQCIFKSQFSSSPMCQWLKGAGLFTIIVVVSLFNFTSKKKISIKILWYWFIDFFFSGIKTRNSPFSVFINLATSSDFWMMMVKNYLQLCMCQQSSAMAWFGIAILIQSWVTPSSSSSSFI